MAVHSATTLAAFIPEVWTPLVLMANEDKAVMSKRCTRVVEGNVGWGDIHHFPNIANISDSAVSSTGTITATAPTETDTTVTVNQWRGASVEILHREKIQTGKYNLIDFYTRKLGYAVSIGRESLLLDNDSVAGLTTNGGGTVGTANAGLTDVEVTSALATLDNNDVSDENRSFIVKPTVVRDFRRVDKYVSAEFSGANPGGLATGILGGRDKPAIDAKFCGTVYGVPMWKSNRVNANGSGWNNWLFHSEAVGLVEQRGLVVEKVPVERLATLIYAWALYGHGVLRGGNAVILIS